MSCKCGENSAGYTAVAIRLTRAKYGVCFVDYDDYRSEGSDGHQNAGLLPLGIADPFRTELAHFHDRQCAFAGEAIN
jgi:hypothetical protein